MLCHILPLAPNSLLRKLAGQSKDGILQKDLERARLLIILRLCLADQIQSGLSSPGVVIESLGLVINMGESPQHAKD